MTREEAIEYLKCADTTVGKKIKTRTAEALEMAINTLEQEPYEVSEYDKDHIWYKGRQYISLRRFLEVKAEAKQRPTDRIEYGTDDNAYKLQISSGKELEQEPCTDAISRQAALSMQYKIDDSATLSTRYVVNVDDIKDLPPVKPVEKVGHWIKTIGENGVTSAVRCSECGFEDNRYMMFRYCPYCGAKMEVEE